MSLSTDNQAKIEEGAKFDAGKTRWSLLPWEALEEVAKVYIFGLQKYKERNWERGMSASRILDALMRHCIDYAKGVRTDKESGLHHLAHCAWNCLTLIFYDMFLPHTQDLVRFKVNPSDYPEYARLEENKEKLVELLPPGEDTRDLIKILEGLRDNPETLAYKGKIDTAINLLKSIH